MLEIKFDDNLRTYLWLRITLMIMLTNHSPDVLSESSCKVVMLSFLVVECSNL